MTTIKEEINNSPSLVEQYVCLGGDQLVGTRLANVRVVVIIPEYAYNHISHHHHICTNTCTRVSISPVFSTGSLADGSVVAPAQPSGMLRNGEQIIYRRGHVRALPVPSKIRG